MTPTHTFREDQEGGALGGRAAPFLGTGQPPQFAQCSTRRAGARSKLSRLWSTSSLRYAGRARATANVILRLVESEAGGR